MEESNGLYNTKQWLYSIQMFTLLIGGLLAFTIAPTLGLCILGISLGLGIANTFLVYPTNKG